MKRAWSKKNLWEQAPKPVKRVVGGLLACAPPAMLLGGAFRKQLARIHESQYWPAERIREEQLRRLRCVVQLAYEQTEGYRTLYDRAGVSPSDIHSLEGFAGLPVIDKETIIEDHAPWCAVAPNSPGVDYVTTGGSSGRQLRFYINAGRSAVEYAYLVAGWQRMGYTLNTPQVVLRGMNVAPDKHGLRHEYDPILRRHYYSNFHTSDASLLQYLKHMRTLPRFFYHVYPSSIAAFARFLQRTGQEPPRGGLGILAGSETIYSDQRRHVEEVLGVRFYSWYGHSEKLVLASECEHSRDYHVWPLYGYAELLDEHDRPITTPGQVGEIVGTGFINTVMPFIRYRTGDFAEYVGDGCEACGREHLIVRNLQGHRASEVLIGFDGAAISFTTINVHDDSFDHVRRYQFQQHEPGKVTLRVIPAESWDNECHLLVQNRLQQRLGDRIALTVETCEDLPLTAAGKSSQIDQRIDLETLSPDGVLIP